MALIRHISWTAFSQVARVGIQFVTGAILARLLTPADYGLVGLSAVFIGFAGLFASLGLGSAVIQRRNVTDDDLSFVFWTNIATGLLLTALTVAAAPLIAGFYEEPRLVELTRLSALGFLISGAGILPQALLQKGMAFQKLAIFEVGATIVASAVGIYLAVAGYGVYSLVLMGLLTQLQATCLRWFLVGWRPKFRMRSLVAKELLFFGGNLAGFGAINYWARNADNLIIGKFLGAVELGFYGRAYNAVLFPVNQVQEVLGPVLFSTFSGLQDQKGELRRLYLRACEAISLVAFPLMMGLLVTAGDFVQIVYGDKWVRVVPLVRVLAIAGFGNAVATTVGWIFTSLGRTDLMLRWGIFSTVVLVSAFLVGLKWGVMGVAIAYVTAYYGILWYPLWAIAGKLIDLKFTTVMSVLSRPFLAACIMGAITEPLQIGTSSLAPLVRFPLTVCIGVLTYWVTIHMMKIESYTRIYERLLSGLWRKQVA
jgi:O-antigen/teichoic acid export membrane protein